MDTQPHKLLHYIDHLWPYITGATITILATIKLWWHEKQQTKRRIRTLEALAENAVTKSELQDCRDDVRQVDEDNLEKIYTEIKVIAKENAKEHQDIMKQMIRLHK